MGDVVHASDGLHQESSSRDLNSFDLLAVSGDGWA